MGSDRWDNFFVVQLDKFTFKDSPFSCGRSRSSTVVGNGVLVFEKQAIGVPLGRATRRGDQGLQS